MFFVPSVYTQSLLSLNVPENMEVDEEESKQKYSNILDIVSTMKDQNAEEFPQSVSKIDNKLENVVKEAKEEGLNFNLAKLGKDMLEYH